MMPRIIAQIVALATHLLSSSPNGFFWQAVLDKLVRAHADTFCTSNNQMIM